MHRALLMVAGVVALAGCATTSADETDQTPVSDTTTARLSSDTLRDFENPAPTTVNDPAATVEVPSPGGELPALRADVDDSAETVPSPSDSAEVAAPVQPLRSPGSQADTLAFLETSSSTAASVTPSAPDDEPAPAMVTGRRAPAETQPTSPMPVASGTGQANTSQQVPVPEPALPMATAEEDAGAQTALDALNTLRREAGREPVRLAPALSAAAARHVAELAERGEVSSLSSTGGGIGDRLASTDINPRAATSLVAGGYGSIDQVLTSFMETPSQRRALLSPYFTQMGFAMTADRNSLYGYYSEIILAAD